MSTLAERTAPPRLNGLPCSVATLLAQLPKSEAAALRRMLANRAWTADAIYDAVIAEGHTVGYQTVQKHRAGRCRCVKGNA